MKFHRLFSKLALIAIACLASSAAIGQEPNPPASPPPSITPSLTVGVLEVAKLSGGLSHLGVYTTIGFGLSIPLANDWALIPSIGFEFCPEFGNWGGTFFITADWLVHQGDKLLIALDPYLGIIHDAIPDGEGGFSHIALIGVGFGPSFILGKTTLSPSLAIYMDTKSKDLVLNPTLLFSVGF